MSPKQEPVGVFQFFYHCTGEDLPVRDYLGRQGHGQKTEPHYENLTENWCSRCMQKRIRSANRLQAEYLFLFTTYRKAGHPKDGKRLVVGFLHRAQPARWMKLNASLRPNAKGFDPNNPEECEFFAGDSKSHFVSAENAFELTDIGNPRGKYFAYEHEARIIVKHLMRSPNILRGLRKTVTATQTNRTPDRCKLSKKMQNGIC